MLLRFQYNWKLEFSEPVEDQYFSMMCLPRNTQRQKVIRTAVRTVPETGILQDVDGFGNPTLSGAVLTPHASFEFSVEGLVKTEAALYEEWEDPGSVELARYRVPSGYTMPGPELSRRFREWSPGAPSDDYGKLLYYMKKVREILRYEPGSTDVSTTAEEAAALGSGVCQDHAHVLIALLRMAGIPARYAVGLMQGEGESHAWVEANCRGWWYGVDPTNDLLVNEGYIKFSHGRDYLDCMISRGIFRNPRATQSQQIHVSVAEEPDGTEELAGNK